MKAIVLNGQNEFSLQEIENPVPASDDVEIRVRMTGICGTDLHLLRGNNPFASYLIIPGHEYMGEVLRAPAESNLKAGDRVTFFRQKAAEYVKPVKPAACPTVLNSNSSVFAFQGVALQNVWRPTIRGFSPYPNRWEMKLGLW